jgi:poly-gamma-glutamate synthesis protein (capsule biosynthesis protein)
MVASCHFASGKLAEIRIHPIDQGFGRPRGQRGRPVLATAAIAKRVIERVARLSKPYGVDVQHRDTSGVVTSH